MKQLKKLVLIGFGLLMGGIAHAQFIGISVDGAIGYTATESTVSGGSVDISHPLPFVPNFGYSALSFIEEVNLLPSTGSESLSSKTTMTLQSYHLFYHVPFPVVSMALGFGLGSANIKSEMSTTVSGVSVADEATQVVPVSEGFIHIGLPFWSILEFHIGYHAFSMSKVDVTKNIDFAPSLGNYTIEEKNYIGGMTTVGLQIAF